MRWSISIFLLAFAGCAARAETASATAAAPDGHKLYVAKCAKCHKFYDPANYSDYEWKIWMRKMSKKAKLKPEQQAAVSEYVEKVLRTPK